jgi:hypothetical protein
MDPLLTTVAAEAAAGREHAAARDAAVLAAYRANHTLTAIADAIGAGFTRQGVRKIVERMTTMNTQTVSADITAGGLQVIATEVLGYEPGVTAGRWASVDLTPTDASRVAAELRQRGYRVTVR